MSKASNSAVGVKTTYEGSVVARAVARAGGNPHLKGHIHEVLVQDARNVRNALTGRVTSLTHSTHARCVDLVTTNGGRVVERIQVKDAVSSTAIKKLVRQVADGKYRSAQLVGTEETAQLANQAFEKAGLAKRMVSSGTSTKTTTMLAQRGGAAGSGTLAGAVTQAAKSGGAMGAAVGAGVEMASGISDLINGRREVGEVSVSVIKAGAKGYATGAASCAAATAGGAAVASGLAAVGAGATATAVATFAAPVAIAVAVGWGVSEVCDWLFD